MRASAPSARPTAGRWRKLLRGLLLLAVASLLVSGVIGGLLRAGVAVPLPDNAAWPGQAVLAHAFLMICGFLGTVIGVERAAAVKARAAWSAPLLSAAAGLLVLLDLHTAAAGLAVAAALAFLAVNVTVVSRQLAPHTALLLTGALAWLVGNLLHALGARASAVVPWWLAFLVLTIAAERLEMARLMRHRRGTSLALYACLGLLLVGAAAFSVAPWWGGWLYGAALLGLALWLVLFDIARRTLAAHGLSRYMALSLLLGYGWLAVSGGAWVAGSLGLPARDMALHALGLGFVFSMVLAHAPVILPALTGVKVQFGWPFYLPLALLHGSLALRLLAGPLGFSMLSLGAAGNAVAMAAFAVIMAGAAWVWHARHPPRPTTARRRRA